MRWAIDWQPSVGEIRLHLSYLKFRELEDYVWGTADPQAPTWLKNYMNEIREQIDKEEGKK